MERKDALSGVQPTHEGSPKSRAAGRIMAPLLLHFTACKLPLWQAGYIRRASFSPPIPLRYQAMSSAALVQCSEIAGLRIVGRLISSSASACIHKCSTCSRTTRGSRSGYWSPSRRPRVSREGFVAYACGVCYRTSAGPRTAAAPAQRQRKERRAAEGSEDGRGRGRAGAHRRQGAAGREAAAGRARDGDVVYVGGAA